MRTIGFIAIASIGLGLSGCSQVSSIFKKRSPSSEATAANTNSNVSLRETPQQPYQFADQSYEVEIYDGASQYAGYAVELYDVQPSLTPIIYSDPREVEFVMLNGVSKASDWQNCETLNRGYLFISKYDYQLDPGFEVCMRNRGYVLTTESGSLSKQTLSARTAGLRGYSQPSQYVQPRGYLSSNYIPSTDLNFVR